MDINSWFSRHYLYTRRTEANRLSSSSDATTDLDSPRNFYHVPVINYLRLVAIIFLHEINQKTE